MPPGGQNLNQPPKLSVILVVRNGAAVVARAVESVAAQRYPNLEFIVWDGLSTDATLAALAPFSSLITLLKSEKDKGHPDAATKAAALATGDYIGFLSADDAYEPGALWAVADAIIAKPQAALVSFGTIHRTKDGKGRSRVIGYYARRDQLELTLANVFSDLPTFVLSRFYRRDLLLAHLPFTCDRESWFYANDREFIARMALSSPENVIIEKALYGFDVNAESITGNPLNLNRIILDHLMIADAFLKRAGLSGEQRRVTIHWRLNQCALGMWRSLMREDFTQAKHFFSKGMQDGWRFLPLSFAMLLRKVMRRLGLAASQGIDAG